MPKAAVIPISKAKRAKRGGARQPEEIRQRIQRSDRASRRGAVKPKDDSEPLLPTEPPAGLTGAARAEYQRIEREQWQWEFSAGGRAFLRASDTAAVVDYCILHARAHRLLELGVTLDKMGELDHRHIAAEIRAVQAVSAARSKLGYLPGAQPHLAPAGEGDDDAGDFGD